MIFLREEIKEKIKGKRKRNTLTKKAEFREAKISKQNSFINSF